MRFAQKALLLLAMGFVFTWLPNSAQAQDLETSYQEIQNQGIIFAGICESRSALCECRDQGKCSLEDIMQVVVNIATFILAISGTILLLVFVIGGFTWLTSMGNPDRVATGRKTMVGGVIGILIVFGAYIAITVIISVLRTGEVPESGETIESVISGQSGTCTIASSDGTYKKCTSNSDCIETGDGWNKSLGLCRNDITGEVNWSQ